MNDGVTVTMAVRLKPEVTDEFCAGLSEEIKPTVGFTGFRDIRVVRHKADRNRLLIIETWDSEASYQAYMEWRVKAGALEEFDRILAAPPGIDIWPSMLAKA
jgi:quinol monooxygenase YgiN